MLSFLIILVITLAYFNKLSAAVTALTIVTLTVVSVIKLTVKWLLY